jgi:hypothetical protein
MAEIANTTTLTAGAMRRLRYLPFSTTTAIRQAVRAGELSDRDAHEIMRSCGLPTRPLPVAGRIRNAFIPAIYDPTIATEWLRFERFPRKAKATGEEALAYAARVLWHRNRRATEKSRHIEAVSHPRFGRAA